MPAYQYLQALPQEDTGQLQEQLGRELAECTEVLPTHRNKLRAFMEDRGIWHISELDYPARAAYEQFLRGQFRSTAYLAYMKAMDLVKLHSIKGQVRAVRDRGRPTAEYENSILFLPYHPDPEIAERFINAANKNKLAWDFGQKAPEKMKRQIFDSLHYVIGNYSGDQLLVHLHRLRELYGFCIGRGIGDIDGIEPVLAGEFEEAMRASGENKASSGIIDLCRKALFMQAPEIRWDANVWYMERLHIQPERLNPAKPVKALSFLEVANKGNRDLLKKYMRYGIGVTNLSISVLQVEMIWVRNFLSETEQAGQDDVRRATGKQMDGYFRKLADKGLQPKSYNAQVMSIQHFFNFLIARGYIERAPFCADYYLKKVVPGHNDRSVGEDVWAEILQKLPGFPEVIRLMYLHLWGIGLRISEVCTLKGDAYYIQGKDAWVQVYQTKMRSYKRIPIPYALYRLMMVYLKKHQTGPDEYVFKNGRGEAYRSATFRLKMQECCEKNGIKGGGYIFKSHDYRHGIATLFYDSGVSLQGVRDYLGHVYEEMTQQYVDYMPKKIEKASEKYFREHGSLAAGLKIRKGGGGSDGEQDQPERDGKLQNGNGNPAAADGKRPAL